MILSTMVTSWVERRVGEIAEAIDDAESIWADVDDDVRARVHDAWSE